MKAALLSLVLFLWGRPGIRTAKCELQHEGAQQEQFMQAHSQAAGRIQPVTVLWST
jgi:hypothetical protein